MSVDVTAKETTQGPCRVECELADGGQLTVEVSGPAAARRAQRALAVAAEELDRPAPKDEPRKVGSYAGIVGTGPRMTALFKMLERIKNSDATVLVLGENGTGKELVAKAIHAESRRHAKAFVATNCSAFNDNLLESELFGHRRGSFTGAVADKPGLFQVADQGTFFMDEVGDMSPALQVKLLRVLQEGVFMPVGGTETKKVDVRIVAATNRDVTQMVQDGTFREDLYYRLHVVSLKVPALRDRREDIPMLVEHFMARLARRDNKQKVLTQRALSQLMLHEWPGNVRELENEMERVWVLSGDDRVLDEDLLSPSVRRERPSFTPRPHGGTSPTPPSGVSAGLASSSSSALGASGMGASGMGAAGMAAATQERGPGSPDPSGPERATTPPGEPQSSSLPNAVEALERQMIADELRRNKGNKTRTAEALGISRRNLIRKVQGYGLEDAGRARPRGEQ